MVRDNTLVKTVLGEFPEGSYRAKLGLRWGIGFIRNDDVPLTEEVAKRSLEVLDETKRLNGYQFNFQANIKDYQGHIGFCGDTEEGAKWYLDMADELIQNNFRKDDVFGILETIVAKENIELNDIESDIFKQKVAEYLVSKEKEAGKEYLERNK